MLFICELRTTLTDKCWLISRTNKCVDYLLTHCSHTNLRPIVEPSNVRKEIWQRRDSRLTGRQNGKIKTIFSFSFFCAYTYFVPKPGSAWKEGLLHTFMRWAYPVSHQEFPSGRQHTKKPGWLCTFFDVSDTNNTRISVSWTPSSISERAVEYHLPLPNVQGKIKVLFVPRFAPYAGSKFSTNTLHALELVFMFFLVYVL